MATNPSKNGTKKELQEEVKRLKRVNGEVRATAKELAEEVRELEGIRDRLRDERDLAQGDLKAAADIIAAYQDYCSTLTGIRRAEEDLARKRDRVLSLSQPIFQLLDRYGPETDRVARER